MKKLNKLVLHKAKIMTAPQMKHITGGYDDVNPIEQGTCAANMNQYYDQWQCGISMLTAQFLARQQSSVGGSGYYCCDNCRSDINCV